MKQYPTELKDYTELVAYLRRCLASEGSDSRSDIASWIVGTVGNQHFDEWYSDPRYPEFWQLFEIAADMEAHEVYGLREEDWQRLKAFIDLFEKKLEIWPRLKTIQDVTEYLEVCLKSDWLHDCIALSILALEENEYFIQLQNSGEYPELAEILEIATKANFIGLLPQASNRLRILVFQLDGIYSGK